MENSICLKKIFKEVPQNSEFIKYFMLGGLYHLVMIACCFIPNLNLLSEGKSLLVNFAGLILVIGFFGFWLETIKTNLSEENAGFGFGKVSIFDNFLAGLIFNLVIIIPMIEIGLLIALILAVPALIFFLAVICGAPGAGVAEYFIAFYFLMSVILLPTLLSVLILIFYPQFVTSYINKGEISVCNLKNIYKLTKNHFKLSFKTSFLTIVLFILSLIPFFGFYFEMVWANLFAKYAITVKETN